MTYFPDLSAYSYRQPSEPIGDTRLFNVGWLDLRHFFATDPKLSFMPVLRTQKR